MIQYPKYPAYQDSGEPWIGGVPQHWTVDKLGNCLKPFSDKGHPDEQLLSITRELGVIERDSENDEDNHNFIPDDLSGYKLLKKGQFGMNKMKAWQGSYGVSQFRGIVSPAYFTFNLSEEINPRYFHVAVRSKGYVPFFGRASDGVRIGQWDLSKSRMKEIPFLIPPIPEQTAIAHFLDNKTAKIDRAIAQKERLIALLKERKQILIQNAVTKGLDPSAKMKDSNEPWIGEVPRHWEVSKLGLCLKSCSERNHADKPLLSITREKGVIQRNMENPEENHNFIPEDLSNYKLLKKGQFGMNKMKAWQGSYGISDFTGIVSPAYYTFTLREGITPEYFSTAIRSKGYIPFFGRASDGVRIGQWDLSQSRMKEIPILIPPVDEQIAIADFAVNQTLKIDVTLRKLEASIERIREYRATLIDSAVTGKIKVPGV